MIDKLEDEIMQNWKGDVNNPIVSVCCITYNHEKYISEAIDGFLMQETNFPFEIIIGEDCSTDNTRSIVDEYCIKYPNIIKLVTSDYNVGMLKNGTRTLKKCIGRYMALCDGDDYWTDTKKLQIQVKFLEKYKEYSMCSHNVEFVFDGIVEKKKAYGKYIIDANFEEILHGPFFIGLNSILYRHDYLKEIPEWFYKLSGGHKAIIYMLSGRGKNHHFVETMAVKRRNPGGITVVEKTTRNKNYYNNNIFLLENLKTYFNDSKNLTINKKIINLSIKEGVKNILNGEFSSAFNPFKKSIYYIFNSNKGTANEYK